MSALNMIQRRSTISAALTTSVRFGTFSQTCCSRRNTAVRFLSSARPLLEDQDVFQWRPNNSTPKAKKNPILPLTVRDFEQKEAFAAQKDNGNDIIVSKNFPRLTTTDLFDQLDPYDSVSPTALRYTGDAVMPITSKLQIVKPQDDTPRGVWPVFRLMVSVNTAHRVQEKSRNRC